MAEKISLDQIKKTISVLREGKEILQFLSDAESAVAVIGSLESNRQSLEKKVADLTNSVNSLSKQEEKYKAEWAKALKEIEEKKAKGLAGVEAGIEEATKKGTERLSAKIDSLNGEIDSLVESRKGIVDEIGVLNGRKQELSKKIGDMNSTIVELQRKHKNVLEQIEGLKAKL